MPTTNKLNEILASREGEELVMGDILRVLALFRKLWSSEVKSEVTSLRLSLNEEPVSMEEIENAINRLRKLGFVKVEERYRTEPTGRSIKDTLISLSLREEEIIDIYLDERLREYQRKRYEAYTSTNI